MSNPPHSTHHRYHAGRGLDPQRASRGARSAAGRAMQGVSETRVVHGLLRRHGQQLRRGRQRFDGRREDQVQQHRQACDVCPCPVQQGQSAHDGPVRRGRRHPLQQGRRFGQGYRRCARHGGREQGRGAHPLDAPRARKARGEPHAGREPDQRGRVRLLARRHGGAGVRPHADRAAGREHRRPALVEQEEHEGDASRSGRLLHGHPRYGGVDRLRRQPPGEGGALHRRRDPRAGLWRHAPQHRQGRPCGMGERHPHSGLRAGVCSLCRIA